ncbi:phosphate/phosphite/phosphonate ABC transporter substrate-binding protein [Oleisolibacter albus]|uniref:phosphate/phosphite/phosphonate ABC transporter substrate-binding protein n=1 Tax=Oleisolibacter albus TaxID=2171757 RepID=UPI000DF1EE11|nr:phosphate/phosphite/phosphonate ABC transporter substrate-binding protein [Oleisolibacter albus]
MRLRLLTLLTALLGLLSWSVQAAEPLRFAVAPFQASPSDTRRLFEPFFRHLAEAVGRPYELTVTTDWAGISVALSSGTVDAAWMGPWGYVLAHAEGGAEAIATVKYDGKPTYHAIMLARPDLPIVNWPADAKGRSISFADLGSTSGWLIPTHWFMTQKIDPKSFFQYREGASHAANVTAVANGQVDLATDYDRNLRAMLDKGLVRPDQVKIVWTSEPLPNDALAVRKGLDPALVKGLQQAATGISEEQARTLMPPHYTGWVAADHASYAMIEAAGRAVGRVK